MILLTLAAGFCEDHLLGIFLNQMVGLYAKFGFENSGGPMDQANLEKKLSVIILNFYSCSPQCTQFEDNNEKNIQIRNKISQESIIRDMVFIETTRLWELR